ncbi:retrovirus-related pol polyprotein from transposon TNT 1-94 [Tanacetum coccineum]
MASIFGSKSKSFMTMSISSQDEPSIKWPVAISLPHDVPSTPDRRLIELQNQVQRMMEAHLAPTQPRDVSVNHNIDNDCSNEAATWDSTPTTAASGIHMDNTCFNEAAPSPNVAATSPENIPHSKPVSFASILNSEQVNKKVNFRSFVNEERVENSDTVLPKAAMESVKNRYVNSLVGYFVGKSLAFPVVRNYVNNTWGMFGLQKVIRNDDGVFMFKFASKEGLDQVLQRGPWMILKSPIILNKWSSGMSLKKGEVTSVPSRISFARALIEVSSESELKSKVTMAIPNEEGDGYTKEVIRVEYEWKPPHCGDCKIFGHDLLQCPKHVEETVFNDPSKVGTSTSTDTSSDGRTKVTRKKNKGTQADEQLRSRHIDGIWLNKPKPHFYWEKRGTNKSGANLGSKG